MSRLLPPTTSVPRRPSRLEAGRLARAKARQQRRRAVIVLLMVAAALLVAVDVLKDHAGVPDNSRASQALAESGGAAPTLTASASASPSPSTPPKVPDTGPGTFTYSSTTGQILGTAGTLHRFQVAVENNVGAEAEEFAGAIDSVLGDPRSWIASGSLRLQRVPQGSPAEFTVYLATPTTSERMCREDGLYTEKYTSCRLASGKVVINLARWLTAVPGYGAPLEVYQAYAINHEVGHQLGHGHEACPGAGKPAPVMEQQTLGLKGCVAYAWPYKDGLRYAGPPIP